MSSSSESRGYVKAESVVSLVLAAIVLVTAVGLQRRWKNVNLGEVAGSAEDFILTKAGIQGDLPQIKGYERLRAYRLGTYRAALYRVSPAPLAFTLSMFVVYDRQDHAVFKLEGLEASQEPWTRLYDFSGRDGISPAGRHRPNYERDLTGDGATEIVIGQYSGGDRCCTTATVVRMGQPVKTVGRITGLAGMPFEGLEIRRVAQGRDWKIIAHRPHAVICGSAGGYAESVSVYAFSQGTPGTEPAYADQSDRYTGYLEEVLRRNRSRWDRNRDRSLALLETVSLNYAILGRQREGEAFFASNLIGFLSQLGPEGADPNVCQARFENLVEQVAAAVPRAWPLSVADTGQ